MNLSRRSFLAAVMGAIAAPMLPRSESMTVWDTLLPKGDLLSYLIWDSAIVQPGQVFNERFFPPPVPNDFSITSLGVYFNAEAPLKSLAEVVRSVRLTLRNGSSDILKAGLTHLPVGMGQPMMPSYCYRRGDDLAIYLDSHNEPVRSVDPITVQVILQGFIRVHPGAGSTSPS